MELPEKFGKQLPHFTCYGTPVDSLILRKESNIVSEINKEGFKSRLVEWYSDNQREFFWRKEELSTFQVLLLETLLKRTNARTVDKFGKEFVFTYNCPEKFLEEDIDKLKSGIQELGYHSRIDELVEICKQLQERELPDKKEDLMEIEGIGQYTADAILCYGFKHQTVPIDVNVARVGESYFGLELPSDLRYASELKNKMERIVEGGDPRVLNWALQDLGNALRSGSDPLGLKT